MHKTDTGHLPQKTQRPYQSGGFGESRAAGQQMNKSETTAFPPLVLPLTRRWGVWGKPPENNRVAPY